MTHLLIATKQLLETLTQWSRHTATEGEVSDVYVRLGYEFNIACRAFTSIGVDTTDLGPVPDLLRLILEETLSQEASPKSLDRFLPRIRDIIINLLHGLKRKQQRLRARQAKEGSQGLGQASRQMSTGSTGSGETGLTQMLEDLPQYRSSTRSSDRRVGSGSTIALDDQGIPGRTTSYQSVHAPTARDESNISSIEESSTRSAHRERRQPPPSLSDASLSISTAQDQSISSPEENKLPIQRMSFREELSYGPPPPPPPKQQDALAALQRGGELERRASRRYSAYQISKHLGASPGGVPMLPPAQNSPLPNRGRDFRESLNAVRTRGSMLPSRQRSRRYHEASPSRTVLSGRISEEGSSQSDLTTRPSSKPQDEDSPIAKTPEDKLGPSYVDVKGVEQPRVSATLRGPPSDSFSPYDEDQVNKPTDDPHTKQQKDEAATTKSRDSTDEDQFIPEQSPQPGKELTLFLQYKSKIKKFVLPDGSNDLSVARLQLAFIEKFAWNTHSNGIDLPDIYIQDPVSGVRHELEDLSDVKDRSVLVLNVEALDEVKRHIDEGLGGIRKVVEGIRTAVDGQQLVISQFSDRQRDAAKEMARLASTTPTTINRTAPMQTNGIKPNALPSSSVEDVQSLRRDLAVMRQTFTSFTTGITSSMAAIRAKAQSVKAKAVDVVIPQLEGDSGRAYVNTGKKIVGDESENIVNRVDDLQDLVEDLRKDVVMRGVRPLPRQLEQVSKDISAATKELKKMQDYVKTEKPIWTKIWEKELETVCNDREFLTMQEELIADLEDDLEKATQTFALVEQATKQQNVQSIQGGGNPIALRSTSRTLVTNLGDAADPIKAKDGVLGEVRALQPNHENRLEAIERAERARQRELEGRREGAAFKKELGSFVEEGRLRKSGGVDEAERLRRQKDERNRKEEWEGQQARKAARAKAREKEKEIADRTTQGVEGQEDEEAGGFGKDRDDSEKVRAGDAAEDVEGEPAFSQGEEYDDTAGGIYVTGQAVPPSPGENASSL